MKKKGYLLGLLTILIVGQVTPITVALAETTTSSPEIASSAEQNEISSPKIELPPPISVEETQNLEVTEPQEETTVDQNSVDGIPHQDVDVVQENEEPSGEPVEPQISNTQTPDSSLEPETAEVKSDSGFIYTDDTKTTVIGYEGASKDVVIPDGVVTIGMDAFSDNQLTSVIIPDSVEFIGDFAFSGNQLTSVTIPNSVAYLGLSAFSDNQLTSVILPDNAIDMRGGVFGRQTASIELLKKPSYSFEELGLSFILQGGNLQLYFKSDDVDIQNGIIKLDNTSRNSFELEWFSPDNLYAGMLTVNLRDGYKVDFNSNEGTEVESQIVEVDGLLIKPVNPVKRGHTFLGWYTDETLETQYDFNSPVKKNQELFAKWQPYETDGDFKYSDNEKTILVGYNGKNKNLVIPNGVKIIAVGALGNLGLTSVTIPEGVESIEFDAFSGNQLTSVTIPDSVTSIGGAAFLGNKLTSVTIPENVKSIGPSVFADNELTSVTIPQNVTTIWASAFSGNKLTSVTIPENVTSIKASAFSKNELTSVIIPDKVQSIERYAFSGNKLSSVIIPENVTAIGENAFANNVLTSVTIPKSVESIEYEAFSNNQLTSVTILNSETSVSYTAFRNQTAVKELLKKTNYSFEELGLSYIKDGTKQPLKLSSTTAGVQIDNDQKVIRLDRASINGFDAGWTDSTNVHAGTLTAKLSDGYTVEFNSDGGNPVASQTVEKGSLFQEPETPTREGYTFEGWYTDIELKNVYDFATIPTENLTLYANWEKDLANYTVSFEVNGGSQIPNQNLTEGQAVQVPTKPTRKGYTFEGWYTDKELKTVYDFDSIPNGDLTLYAKWKQDDFIYSDEAKTILIEYRGTSKDVVIPDGVVTIGDSVFERKQLTSVTIPESVRNIGDSAFLNNKLISVTIPNGVQSIGIYAFSNNQLTSVTIPESVTTIKKGAFYANQLTSVAIPENVTSIEEYAFYGNQLISVTIPESVTSIENSTFANNQLTSVIIPENVTSIESSAFINNQLTSVTIPESVMSIKENAFYANKLTSVTIPNGVQSIGIYAFSNNQLTSVTIPESVTSIGNGAFYANKLTSVTIPKKVNSIKGWTFAYNQLTRVTIPENVTSIEEYAFYGNQLTDVNILNIKTSIGRFALYNQKANIELLKKTSYSFEELGISYTKAGLNQPLNLITTAAGVQIDEDQKVIRIDSTSTNEFTISWTEPSSGYSGNLTVKLRDGYTVDFNSNEGSDILSQTIEKGSLFKEPEKPTRAGYTFEGWYVDKELKTVYDFATIPQYNLTLYAKWKKDLVKYTVSFEENGGSDVADQTVTEGESVQIPTKPTRKDYTFEAWYADKELKTVYDFDSIPKGDLTLYAKWEEDEFIYADEAKTMLKKYNGTNKDVVIPDGVVTISSRVFASKQLTSVTIPESVRFIEDSAFFDNKLIRLTIPEGVTSIGNAAFSSNKLTSVTIPSSVTFIGPFAFSFNQLASVTIPEGVTSIENSAFSYNQLVSVTIPEDVISIGGFAFSSNKLTSVIIPESVTSIGNSAFQNNQLTSVTLLNSATSIGLVAFGTQIPNIELLKKTSYSFEELGLSYTKAGLNQPLNLITTAAGVQIDDDQKVIKLDSTSTNEFTISWTEPSNGYSGTLKVKLRDGYTVEFDSNGGNTVASQTIEKESLFKEPETPTRTGYTFEGWYADDELKTLYDFTTIPTGGLTLYAKWKKDLEKYTVSFEVNAGSEVTEQTVTEGQAVQEPTKPTRTGYTFEGWYADDELKTVYDFATKPTGNLTLYAKWKKIPETYLVFFELNGGRGVIIDSVLEGQSVQVPSKPTKVGYKFEDWYADEELKTVYNFNTIPTGNLTLYAKWEKILANYTVSFEVNGGSEVIDQTVTEGQLVQAPIKPTRTGYTFEGWYADKELQTVYDFDLIPAGNLTLYAKWEKILVNYTVSFDSLGGSEINPLKVLENKKITKPSNPTKVGYKFLDWYADKELTELYDFETVVTSNFTLYAKWEQEVVPEISYTVSFDSLGGNKINPLKVLENTKVVKPANPTRVGYKFIGWYTDKELNEAYDFETAVISNFTLYAKWEQEVVPEVSYTVSFDSLGGSEINPLKVLENTKVVKPSNPIKVGYKFLGWYADKELTKAYDFEIEVTSNFTLYAKWEQEVVPEVSYTVSFDTLGGNEINPLTVVENTKVAKPTDPTKVGYKFLGWYADKELTEAYDFETTVTSDFTLYAKWEKISVVPVITKPTVTEPKPNQTLTNGKGNSKVADKSLPKTGEKNSFPLITLGGFLLVVSLYAVIKQRKRQDEI